MEEGITVVSGISDDVADDDLEDAVTSIMKDVDVIVQNGDIEACHRIGKSDHKTSSKKKKQLLDLSIVNTVRKY